MAAKRPKVQRRGTTWSPLVIALTVSAVLLGAALIALVATGTLVNDVPRSDAERDYQLLVAGVKKDAKNPTLLMTLAETEYDLGKKKDALEHAERAVKYAGEAPAYRLRYAQLLLLTGDEAKARAMIEDEIALKTAGDPEPYFLLAQLERSQKRYDAAVDAMRTGLKMSPTSADMLILYGDMLVDAGEKDAAIAQYKAALRYLPGDPRATKGLEALGVKAPASTPTTAHGAPAGD